MRNKFVTQVLVQWQGERVEDATWESPCLMQQQYPHLMGKVFFFFLGGWGTVRHSCLLYNKKGCWFVCCVIKGCRFVCCVIRGCSAGREAVQGAMTCSAGRDVVQGAVTCSAGCDAEL